MLINPRALGPLGDGSSRAKVYLPSQANLSPLRVKVEGGRDGGREGERLSLHSAPSSLLLAAPRHQGQR